MVSFKCHLRINSSAYVSKHIKTDLGIDPLIEKAAPLKRGEEREHYFGFGGLEWGEGYVMYSNIE